MVPCEIVYINVYYYHYYYYYYYYNLLAYCVPLSALSTEDEVKPRFMLWVLVSIHTSRQSDVRLRHEVVIGGLLGDETLRLLAGLQGDGLTGKV